MRCCKMYGDFITRSKLNSLRDNTSVGSFIEFVCEVKYKHADYLLKNEIVRGVVKAKYDHVFVIQHKHGAWRTYTWFDYYLGKTM